MTEWQDRGRQASALFAHADRLRMRIKLKHLIPLERPEHDVKAEIKRLESVARRLSWIPTPPASGTPNMITKTMRFRLFEDKQKNRLVLPGIAQRPFDPVQSMLDIEKAAPLIAREMDLKDTGEWFEVAFGHDGVVTTPHAGAELRHPNGRSMIPVMVVSGPALDSAQEIQAHIQAGHLRSIVIDPFTRTVSEVWLNDVDPGLRVAIDPSAPPMTRVAFFPGVDVWLDDEGMFREEQMFWGVTKGDQSGAYAGRGVMVGITRNGDTVGLPAKITVQAVQGLVEWVGDAHAYEAAIQRGRYPRPTTIVNGEVIWSWSPSEIGLSPAQAFGDAL